MKARLAVVITHPIQHFCPLFRQLAEAGDVELKVFFCCDWGVSNYQDPGFDQSFKWDIPLLEGYEYEFLPIKRRPSTLGFFEIDNPSVGKQLARYKPHAVWVHGYAQRTAWRAHKWARNNSRIIYFSDSELLHHRKLKAKLLKRIILPWYFRHCDVFITIGDNNEDYYRHYHVADHKMIRGAFPVDIKRYQGAIEGLANTERNEIRRRYGLKDDAIIVLFCGKYIDIKRPLDLVMAIQQLKIEDCNVQALFIGSGELLDSIEKNIRKYDLDNYIKLAGFVNQKEMPRILHAGDIFAMTSEVDPHPLVVTESMAVGNVIIASDKVGCVGPTDAARPGQNCIVYPVGDIKSLANGINWLVQNPVERARMSRKSREIAWSQDVSIAASAVSEAVAKCLESNHLT